MTAHAADVDAQADLEQLQGVWASVFGRREADLLVAGRLFTVRFADGEVYMGAFQLNPAAWPKAIDMRVDEGPARHKGKIALCIYEVEEGALRWCAAGPGLTERLTNFPPEAAAEYLHMVFRREPR